MTDQTKTPDPDNVVPEGELERRRFIAGEVERVRAAALHAAQGFGALESAGVPVASWLPLVVAQLPAPFNERLGGDIHYGVAFVEGAAAIFQGKSLVEIMPHVIASLTNGSPAAGFGAHLAARFLGVGSPSPSLRMPPMPIGVEDELRRLMADGGDAEGGTFHGDDSTKATRMRLTIERLFADSPRMMLPNGQPDPSQAPALQCHVVLNASVPPIEGVLSTTPEGGLRLMTPMEVDAPKDPNAHPRMPPPKKMVMLEQFFDYGDVVAICVQRDITATPSSSSIIS